MSSNVTIQDLAESLGMSRNTVSKALNGKHVPIKTRNAVISAAIEMGYKGYKIAASGDGSTLAQKRFLILTGRLLLNINYHIYVLRGIEEALSDYDIDLVQFNITSSSSFAKLKRFLNANKVDGIIALEFFDHKQIEELAELAIPMVFLDFPYCDHAIKGRYDIILPESRDAVMYTCNQLIQEQGCKTFGFVGDFRHCRSFFERYCGMTEALLMSGLHITPQVSITHDDSLTYSPAILANAIQNLPEIPDCFVAANDYVALSLLKALKSLKIAVPPTTKVLGFDNGTEGKTSDPPLTTFNVNKHALGKQLISVLLERIAHPSRANNIIYIASKPITRSST